MMKNEYAVNYILAMNPDVNIQNKKGYTPLHYAVKR